MPNDENVSAESSAAESLETVDASSSEQTTDEAQQEASPTSESSESQDESASESDSEETSTDRGPKSKVVVPETAAAKRIKQLIADNKKLKQQLAPVQRDEVKLDAPKPPKEEDFNSYAELQAAERKYAADLAAHEARKAVQEDRAAQQKARHDQDLQERQNEATATWKQRLSDTAKRHPEFKGDDAVRAALVAVKPNQALDQFFVESEIGPDLLRHLAADPEEAERFRDLSPIATIREAAKLEAELLGHIKGTPPRRLRPPSYVDGGAAPQKQKFLENILYGD